MTEEVDQWLPLTRISEVLGIPYVTLYRWRTQGRLMRKEKREEVWVYSVNDIRRIRNECALAFPGPKPIEFSIDIIPSIDIICGSCATGEHMCDGQCDCGHVFCLRRRFRQKETGSRARARPPASERRKK